ncbi:MAG TPA: RNA polymerase sigma factor [Bacteroidales bacterium]|nr:RNA polymerase sigma factor [Paludibacteraceae bacterium]HPT02780.1 RNA polymerase sigma factor [Bacteroidales bacterium]
MTRDDFIICIKLYTPNLLRFSKRVAGNVIEAEDIVQECFEILWKNQEKVEINSAKSYLFSIAHKKIIDTFRTDRKMQDFESASEELVTKPDEADTEQLVRLAINQIPALYRELITLRDLEGYSYKEIESITGLSEARVKVTLFRARKQIKDRILQLEVS